MRVDPSTATKWAAENRLGSVRTPGGRLRFFESEIRALIARRPDSAPA